MKITKNFDIVLKKNRDIPFRYLIGRDSFCVDYEDGYLHFFYNDNWDNIKNYYEKKLVEQNKKFNDQINLYNNYINNKDYENISLKLIQEYKKKSNKNIN